VGERPLVNFLEAEARLAEVAQGTVKCSAHLKGRLVDTKCHFRECLRVSVTFVAVRWRTVCAMVVEVGL
jgi:hypothetical protein